MGMLTTQPWEASSKELKRCFSYLKSLEHVASEVENMTQHPDETLHLYAHRYSKMHYAVTNKTVHEKTNPSRSFRHVSKFEHFHRNLQECFRRSLDLEAGYQLAEGINLACVTNVLSVHIEAGYLNKIRPSNTRARSNGEKLVISTGIILSLVFYLKV